MDPLAFDLLLLFFAASLHDDVAIVMAALFAYERGVPPAYGLTAVYTGTIANNYVLYRLGAAARRVPGLRRWLIGEKVGHVRQRLKKHLVPTMVLCRIIPGSLSPAILGCGWLGIPFARFALTTVISAALYLALVSALVFTLGETVLQRLSGTAGLVAFVLLAFGLLFINCRARNRKADG
jgi:membrane protein DedA with SNARE-associated domain